jgi:DNA-binding GntR family transcriptional regulator
MSLDDLPDISSLHSIPDAKPAARSTNRIVRADKLTRAEDLRQQLADEIVRGTLAPGASLDEARAHRGAVVAQPSIERLGGMFEAMAELEALCAGLAAERMMPAERHRLEAIHEELRVLSHAGDPERFHAVNEQFHSFIYTGSQNAHIAEITLATRKRVQPFRRAQFRNLGRLAQSHAEHDRVVVAIMRGDRSGAANAMRAHIERVHGEYEIYAVSV